MESKNNNTEVTQLCSNCKSFYGTQDTDFLCSKCFKENKDVEQKEALNELAASNSPSKLQASTAAIAELLPSSLLSTPAEPEPVKEVVVTEEVK